MLLNCSFLCINITSRIPMSACSELCRRVLSSRPRCHVMMVSDDCELENIVAFMWQCPLFIVSFSMSTMPCGVDLTSLDTSMQVLNGTGFSRL